MTPSRPPSPEQPPNAAPTSLLARAISRLVVVTPGELPLLLMSFATVFFMFSSYMVLKPVRETMGIDKGWEELPALFWGTFIAMLAVQPVYGWLTSRYRRAVFLPWVYSFFILNLLGFWLWFTTTADHTWIAKSYFIWVSVFNLFVVSVFWSLMADLFTREQAGRMFGFIAAGLSLGGLFGPLLSGKLAKPIGTVNLLLVGAGLLTIALMCMMLLLGLHRRLSARHAPVDSAFRGDHAAPAPDATLRGGMFAAFRSVAASPYLIGMAAFIFLLTWASTFLYLEQNKLVAETFATRDDRTQFFSRVEFWVQTLSLLMQMLLFGRILRWFPLPAVIVVVPLILTAGFVTIAVHPVFSVLVGVMIVRRIGEYSIVRPCRETLWAGVDRQHKYQAKSLIDTFVYRGGDAVSGSAAEALRSSFGFGASGIALVGAAVALAWGAVGFWLARRAPDRPAR